MYRAVVGSDSFTDLQTLDFLLERSRLSTTTSFGTLIQSFKDIPDLEKFTKNFQTHLYQKWASDYEITPIRVENLLGPRIQSISRD
ncbi:hypothetical protein JG688_00008959 [Phytophthora aleatoria]|uniref:RXLR phytopathogen effector protein WY-domain domain-containing protein n=1 Tax=Phytophthora aleatoria TaxID=2496075 RepID=A0A8J5IMA8_9STRA|nr:hypothetical protein JG688_00008959 [Phytophthora aleatoria]